MLIYAHNRPRSVEKGRLQLPLTFPLTPQLVLLDRYSSSEDSSKQQVTTPALALGERPLRACTSETAVGSTPPRAAWPPPSPTPNRHPTIGARTRPRTASSTLSVPQIRFYGRSTRPSLILGGGGAGRRRRRSYGAVEVWSGSGRAPAIPCSTWPHHWGMARRLEGPKFVHPSKGGRPRGWRVGTVQQGGLTRSGAMGEGEPLA